MNIEVRSEGFSPHNPEITTEVVTTNKSARSEDFSPHIPPNATTEVVTTNVEVGGTCYV